MSKKTPENKPVSAATKGELFSAEEVQSVVPELERARRAAEATKSKNAKGGDRAPVTEHRYTAATRKNLPAAGDALGHVAEEEKITFAYDPHRTPVLRFNEAIIRQRALLDEARRRPLTAAETEELATLLEAQQPWLEWAGKREQPDFTVDPVALHIHERVSAQAILRAVRREDIQRDLFADAFQSAKEARAYYQHDVAWANRLITGDSLQVMTSLARREGLAGQVQMIYFDPPYGIKFSSNWQNEVGKRDVKDKDEDLTREPEMIRAYRDTWTLGVHSYLAYLKQRLIVARELLKESGSIFVQISDENLHRVRAVMDEVFGAENFCSVISFQKTGGMSANLLPTTVDFILWYAKERDNVCYNQLFLARKAGDTALDRYDQVREPSGLGRPISDEDLSSNAYPRFQLTSLFSDGASNTPQQFEFRSSKFEPKGNAHWKTSIDGLARLGRAERIEQQGERLRYIRYADDFSLVPISDRWESVQIGKEALYVVQTASAVIERCMLMTTNPGDLVLDPTCGSGTIPRQYNKVRTPTPIMRAISNRRSGVNSEARALVGAIIGFASSAAHADATGSGQVQSSCQVRCPPFHPRS